MSEEYDDESEYRKLFGLSGFKPHSVGFGDASDKPTEWRSNLSTYNEMVMGEIIEKERLAMEEASRHSGLVARPDDNGDTVLDMVHPAAGYSPERPIYTEKDFARQERRSAGLGEKVIVGLCAVVLVLLSGCGLCAWMWSY